MAATIFKKGEFPLNNFKITIMGSVGSGKTSLCNQIISNYFSDVIHNVCHDRNAYSAFQIPNKTLYLTDITTICTKISRNFNTKAWFQRMHHNVSLCFPLPPRICTCKSQEWVTTLFAHQVHMHTRRVKSHVRMMKLRRDYESSPTIEYPLIPQTVPAYYVYSTTGDDEKCAIEVESYSLELQDTPGRVVSNFPHEEYSHIHA